MGKLTFGDDVTLRAKEYKELFRVFVTAEKIDQLLERVGWPIIMNEAVASFRKALEAYRAERLQRPSAVQADAERLEAEQLVESNWPPKGGR